jgi:GntR family transcriptional regulator/MocR family aminotransferase
MLETLIILDEDSELNLQAQIRQKLVEVILSGLFPVGQRLPSSRKLADHLCVARNTVVLAYQQLIDEGYLLSRERSGIYVNEEVLLDRVEFDQKAKDSDARNSHWHKRFKAPLQIPAHFECPPNWQQYPYPFIDGQFDQSLFPTAEWREATRLALGVREINQWACQSGDADDTSLIEQIRCKVLPRRGINARPDEILVTIGSQQALYILAQLLVNSSSSVAVEEPGHPEMRQLLARQGAALRHQPVDEQGMVVDEHLAPCHIAVVTPSHQLPTAVTMSLERRQALLDMAERSDLIIIEDDSDSESNFLGNPHPALKSLDENGRVVYVSSLSKILSSSLRIGFMVGPAELIREARNLRRLMVKSPAANNQRAAAFFLSLGHYDASMRKLNQEFRKRWEALRDALNYLMPNFVVTIPNEGGTAYWVQGPAELDVKYLAKEAAKSGILIEPVDYYFATPADKKNCFRLGVSSINVDQIREGIEALAQLIQDLAGGKIARLRESDPCWLKGEVLRESISDTQLLYQTVYGQPLSVVIHADGRLSGTAGYANEESDVGRWWVEGDLWVRQWDNWAYGEEVKLYTVIKGKSVKWFNTEKMYFNRAVIRAID